MNLNDYITLSSERPNRAVLQGLGASEELIEYLMETPENTNWNVVGSLSGSGSDEWIEPDKGILIFSTTHTDYESAPITILEGSNFQTEEQLINWCYNGKHNVETDLTVTENQFGEMLTYNFIRAEENNITFKYSWYLSLYIGTSEVLNYTDGG